ncbi:MAG: hypothetical protein WAU58_15245, partial [Terriglobales bacterium]
FTVLLVAAFGAGCKGFFTGDTIQSISIQPSTINLQVTDQQQFTAWGTDQNNNRSQITSGLVWSSSDPSVSITSGGLATALTVTNAAVTIYGDAQGLQGTATVNVIGNVTSMTVSPTSQAMTEGTAYPFTFTGSPGPPTYITSSNGGTLTVTATGTGGTSDFSCVVGTDAKGNPAEVCTATSGAAAGSPYSIQMTYPTPSGGTATATSTATVSGS